MQFILVVVRGSKIYFAALVRDVMIVLYCYCGARGKLLLRKAYTGFFRGYIGFCGIFFLKSVQDFHRDVYPSFFSVSRMYVCMSSLFEFIVS